MHEIVVLAFPDSIALDLAVPSQVFHTAEVDGTSPYRVRVCSVDGSPVSTNAGFTAVVDHDVSLLRHADTVIVAPGGGARRTASEGLPGAVRAELEAARERGARIASICTGAFVLGAAGMLDGRRATTYWSRGDEFRRLFPSVELDLDAMHVDDGGIHTSAGVMAGVDLCLALVRRDHGAAVANAVARRLVMPPVRPGGQAPFVEHERVSDDDQLGASLSWALAHLDAHCTVADLARRAHMSQRTFTRRVRERTGRSPADWMLEQRLAAARDLLETTDDSIGRVAARCGFGTASHMRAQFQRRLGQSPSDFRRVFRPALV